MYVCMYVRTYVRMYVYICAYFVHSIVCLMTGPQPLPKWLLHRVQSCASSCIFLYTLFSLWSSSSCIRLLPRLPVTSILPFIFPSIMVFQKAVPIQDVTNQLAFLLFTVCRIFFSSFTLCNTVPFLTLLVTLIYPILLQHHTNPCFKCSTLNLITIFWW